MARKAPRTSLASRGKRSTHPSHASPIPARRTCDCGSGLADTETIPSSGGVLACSRCYNRKHDAYAFTGGVAEHSDDPRDGSGWHYSRNPPQRYTITEGGRRARLAGGNTFPSKGEAQDAAKFLRHTEGGDYKVRALKPGESVGRMAVANGKKSARSRKMRGATGVRCSMGNGRTTITVPRDDRTERDLVRLKAGGVRGGEFGENAVAVFGSAEDDDETSVVMWISANNLAVKTYDRWGDYAGTKKYGSRSEAFYAAEYSIAERDRFR